MYVENANMIDPAAARAGLEPRRRAAQQYPSALKTKPMSKTRLAAAPVSNQSCEGPA